MISCTDPLRGSSDQASICCPGGSNIARPSSPVSSRRTSLKTAPGSVGRNESPSGLSARGPHRISGHRDRRPAHTDSRVHRQSSAPHHVPPVPRRQCSARFRACARQPTACASNGVEVTCSDTAPAAARASARATLATRYMAPIVSANDYPAAQCPRMRSSARSSDRPGGSNTMVNGAPRQPPRRSGCAQACDPYRHVKRHANTEKRHAGGEKRFLSVTKIPGWLRGRRPTARWSRTHLRRRVIRQGQSGAAAGVSCALRNSDRGWFSLCQTCQESLVFLRNFAAGFVSVGSVEFVGEVTQRFAQALLLGNERIAITP